MKYNKQLAPYGLKWNPFATDLPTEALIETEAITRFIWKVENLVLDGGFAMITGEPGTGKSVALRILNEKLKNVRDIKIQRLTRPQSTLVDFYRELGEMFDLDLKPNNRWGGYKNLRDRWKQYVATTLLKPVLLIDEAQEMPAVTLSEIRLLSSVEFDSQSVLTVVLCGDRRLPEKFRTPDLVPLGSRIRTRLNTEPASRKELMDYLAESITKAGNHNLLPPELIQTLADHASGNYRILTIMANEILMEAVKQGKNQITEQLFFDVYQPVNAKKKNNAKKGIM